MQQYDLNKLKALLRDFYNLTHIKICVYDSNENELCFYPQKLSSFCQLLRENKAMDETCRECDHRAFEECKRTRKQYVYTCHAGLTECVSPILFEQKIAGFIVLGQIKADGNTSFPDELKNKLTGRVGELADRFDRLPTLSEDKIRSAVHIMDACTGYEYLKSLMNSVDNTIDARVKNYVAAHLDGDLSVPALCSEFHLSHSEIYLIFKEYFDETPAEYVKKTRLKKACELLKTSTLKVHKIAETVGIANYNYFSKIFKNEFSQSPRDYRKTQRKAPE